MATTWIALACSVYELPDTSERAPGAAGLGATSPDGGRSPTGGASAGGASPGGSATNVAAAATMGGTASGGEPGAPTDGGVPADGGASAGEGGAAHPPDACPSDPDKLEPGRCGCGIPDENTPPRASCETLKSKLLHRYDFEGTGTAVRDRVGTAHGMLRGASLSKLDGRGVVLLGGGNSGGYVDLPNQLISSLGSASFEAWITWGGGNSWQRIFDFGDSTHASPENNPASGKSYLFVTPKDMSGVLSAAYATGVSGSSEEAVAGPDALPLSLAQVVVVMDDAANQMQLFLNGKRVGAGAWTGSLSALNDVNVWLGRSQFEQDPELSAVFHELRIYGTALTDAQVATAFAAGTDPTFLAY